MKNESPFTGKTLKFVTHKTVPEYKRGIRRAKTYFIVSRSDVRNCNTFFINIWFGLKIRALNALNLVC